VERSFVTHKTHSPLKNCDLANKLIHFGNLVPDLKLKINIIDFLKCFLRQIPGEYN
jgi:hypothetical protein